MTHGVPCPFCGARQVETVFSAGLDFSVATDRPSGATAMLCHRCGLVFLGEAYAEADYDRSADAAYAAYDFKASQAFPHRQARYVDAVAIIRSHMPSGLRGDVLDVGSNRGDLLFLLKEACPEINILGVDPTATRETYVPTVRERFRAELFSNRFDGVILHHSLEHFKYPQEVIAQVHAALKPGGWLFLGVPNLQAKLELGVDEIVSDHVSYFTRPFLDRLLAGFSVRYGEGGETLKIFATRRDGRDAGRVADQSAEQDDQRIQSERLRRTFTDYRARRAAAIAAFQACLAPDRPLIFYGCSFYFSRLYRAMAAELASRRVFYFDDQVRLENDPFHGLPRAADDFSGSVVLLCSNNAGVQDRLEARVGTRGSRMTIVKPWHTVTDRR